MFSKQRKALQMSPINHTNRKTNNKSGANPTNNPYKSI